MQDRRSKAEDKRKKTKDKIKKKAESGEQGKVGAKHCSSNRCPEMDQ